MNTPYQPQPPKPSGLGSEVLLAFLLIIAFVQIALCFQASTGIVRGESVVRGDNTASTLNAHTPLSNGMTSVTNAQPSGFPSVPTRG